MKVSEHPGVMLLAVKLDGHGGVGYAACGVCGRCKVEFVASIGMRTLLPRLPARETVCVNADGPCLMALRAKKWLDALREVSR